MKRLRKAYSLNEIIFIMAMLTVIMSFSSKIFYSLVKEIPLMIRSVNVQSSTDAMLESLAEDVEKAQRIRLSVVPENQLTLEGPQGVVFYTFHQEQMRRTLPDPNQAGHSVWPLPDVRLDWQLYKNNGFPAALEVCTWQQRLLLGQKKIHFRQKRLFFVGLQKESNIDE